MAVDVVMPRLSDSMEEGTVIEWLVAEGDEVKRGQPIVEIETDKATMPYEAESDGVLLKIAVPAGETAALGDLLAVIGAAGEAVEDRPAAGPTVTAAGGDGATSWSATADAAAPPVHANGSVTAVAAAPAPASGPSGRVPASPLARRIAAALGVDLHTLTGTGPNGRVVRADVEAAAQAVAGPPAAASQSPALPPERSPLPSAPAGARGDVTVQQPSRLQQTVARRMAESRATVPEFELTVDVDMGEAVDLRERLRALEPGPETPLPSYNDMVVKACALALREFPRANGAYRDGAFETFSRVNVGVAVAADDALVVPTVFDADRGSLGEIARRTRELAGKVRDGSITPSELAGATFTVSNLGMFGIDSFTAVVNVPQAAILAVGALKKRPVVFGPDDAIVARPVMTLTLACDHRILYGADGARFLARVRALLEQPLAFAL